MLITRRSAFSGLETTRDINITDEQYNNWAGGMLIQNAFPHLSDDDREFLINGTTEEEWAEHTEDMRKQEEIRGDDSEDIAF